MRHNGTGSGSCPGRIARCLLPLAMLLTLASSGQAIASESLEPLASARAAAVSYRPIPAGSELDILPASNSRLATQSAASATLILKQKGYQVSADASLVVDVNAVLVRGVSRDQGPEPPQGAQQGPLRGDPYTNPERKNPADDPLTRGNLYSSEHGALLTPARPRADGDVLHVSIAVYDRKTGRYVWRAWADRVSGQVGIDSSAQQMILGLLGHFGDSLPQTDLLLY